MQVGTTDFRQARMITSSILNTAPPWIRDIGTGLSVQHSNLSILVVSVTRHMTNKKHIILFGQHWFLWSREENAIKAGFFVYFKCRQKVYQYTKQPLRKREASKPRVTNQGHEVWHNYISVSARLLVFRDIQRHRNVYVKCPTRNTSWFLPWYLRQLPQD